MKTQEIQQNKSSLGHGIRAAIIGGAIGYGAKYALPLTSQEMDSDYKHVINLIKRNSIKAKNEFLAEIKDIPTKSLAQDAYINSSKKFAKHNACAYNHALKKIRPAAPFIIAGAVTGLVGSFVHSVFRTDV